MLSDIFVPTILKGFFHILNAKLLGYYNDYGVVDYLDSINRYFYEALRVVFKWHNRRSQQRSKNCSGFMGMLKHLKVPKPRIVERIFDSKAACRA